MCTQGAPFPKIFPLSSHPSWSLSANMVDFQNPVIIEKDFLALVKLFHVVDGIFIWEFFVTLNYEWSVIRGHRPYRWTIWIYSLARVCTLIAAVLNMLAFDFPTPINCRLWIIFEDIFISLAFAAASFLIVLRIIAIWNRNMIAVGIAICTWSNNVAFLIYNIVLLRSTWEPVQSACIALNMESSKKAAIVGLVTDVVLLLTMLFGLLRLRLHGNMFGLGQLLWNQGLILLFLATVAGVTPTVFISLNLNGPFDAMFQTPAIMGMTICATRMHRSLTDFTNPESFHTYPIRMGHAANRVPKPLSAAAAPLDRVEVAVHTSSEDYPPLNMGQYASCGAYSADNQSQDKSFVLDICSDRESGVK
ncbi:hypothetical protein V8E53_000259 [Lactarius tabidus]